MISKTNDYGFISMLGMIAAIAIVSAAAAPAGVPIMNAAPGVSDHDVTIAVDHNGGGIIVAMVKTVDDLKTIHVAINGINYADFTPKSADDKVVYIGDFAGKSNRIIATAEFKDGTKKVILDDFAYKNLFYTKSDGQT